MVCRRRRVSIVCRWTLESFAKFVPLLVVGRRDRWWDVVPALWA